MVNLGDYSPEAVYLNQGALLDVGPSEIIIERTRCKKFHLFFGTQKKQKKLQLSMQKFFPTLGSTV